MESKCLSLGNRALEKMLFGVLAGICDKKVIYVGQIVQEIRWTYGMEKLRGMVERMGSHMYSITEEEMLARAHSKVQSRKRVTIVEILKAARFMANGILQNHRRARLGQILLQRHEDPVNNPPKHYFTALPFYDGGIYVIVDIAFATAGTAIRSTQEVLDFGVPPEKVFFLAGFASESGIQKFEEAHPKVQLYYGESIKRVNDKGMFVDEHGDLKIGDIGGRLFFGE